MIKLDQVKICTYTNREFFLQNYKTHICLAQNINLELSNAGQNPFSLVRQYIISHLYPPKSPHKKSNLLFQYFFPIKQRNKVLNVLSNYVLLRSYDCDGGSKKNTAATKKQSYVGNKLLSLINSISDDYSRYFLYIV